MEKYSLHEILDSDTTVILVDKQITFARKLRCCYVAVYDRLNIRPALKIEKMWFTANRKSSDIFYESARNWGNKLGRVWWRE